MAEDKILRETWSVCPVCFRRIAARQVLREGAVYLEKSCPVHGAFSAVVWRGGDLGAWRGGWPSQTQEPAGCPDNCGLCGEHLQKTCCVLIEVTGRCNLRCPHCFAEGKIDGGLPDNIGAGCTACQDPSADEIKGWIREIARAGRSFLQFSGGEPTVREDLPELIAYAKEAGCQYVQLNSNGIRLGEEAGYASELAAAGLDFVFLQFDGTEDEIYERLRGRRLLSVKKKAIERCGAARIGVTLVPMVVPGVNDENIGELVKYGLSLSPVVRGIHFQPVSYFGRYETPPADAERITLPEILKAMETQTDGLVRQEFFTPSCCDHPMCGFHGDFIALPGDLRPLTQKKDCCTPTTAEQNRNFVGRRWKREEASAATECCCGTPEVATPADSAACCCEQDGFDAFLNNIKTYGFTITAMAFQDAYTLDLERLRNCSLHVYQEGRIVPFCSRYLPR